MQPSPSAAGSSINAAAATGKSSSSSNSAAAAKVRLHYRLQAWGVRALKGPSVSHSALFGAAGALLMYGGYYAYRGVKLLCFDTETPALQSRLRYAEKQQLYLRELDETLAAGHLASLAAEYDPVATRLPFQPLEARYRF